MLFVKYKVSLAGHTVAINSNLLCHKNDSNVFTNVWAVFWYHGCRINWVANNGPSKLKSWKVLETIMAVWNPAKSQGFLWKTTGAWFPKITFNISSALQNVIVRLPLKLNENQRAVVWVYNNLHGHFICLIDYSLVFKSVSGKTGSPQMFFSLGTRFQFIHIRRCKTVAFYSRMREHGWGMRVDLVNLCLNWRNMAPINILL